MSLIKHSPMSSLRDPSGSFEDLMDQFFNRREQSPMSGFLNPATDVKETDTEFTITSEMPGVQKDQVKVDLHEGILTISAEKSEEKSEEEEGKVVWRERRQGQFVRRFNLGKHVDADHIQANFENGVLKIKVQKTGDAPSNGKTIPIS